MSGPKLEPSKAITRSELPPVVECFHCLQGSQQDQYEANPLELPCPEHQLKTSLDTWESWFNSEKLEDKIYDQLKDASSALIYGPKY